jgi:hypothetical protein
VSVVSQRQSATIIPFDRFQSRRRQAPSRRALLAGLIYSKTLDVFFFGMEDVLELMTERRCSFQSLCLVSCEPTSQIRNGIEVPGFQPTEERVADPSLGNWQSR